MAKLTDAQRVDIARMQSGFYPYATKDGKWFRATDRAGIYVVYKDDPENPSTDDGWVYGTVAIRGEVTSAGRVASCMGCHVTAPQERLFGLPDRVYP